MNIFDYARNRIKTKYRSRCDYEDVKDLETLELSYINDYEEEKSNQSLKDAIACKLEIYWQVQSDEEKLFIVLVIAATLFALYVFLNGLSRVPFNLRFLRTSECFLDYFAIMGIVFLYRLIRRRTIRKRLFYIVWLLFFLLSIPYIPVLFGHQTTQIGTFYEARTYKAKYNVILSRESSNVSNRKLYTLPAEIERKYDYTGYDEHGDYYELNYHVNYIYFPNGGYLSFDYDYAYDEPSCSLVAVNRETIVTDSHDDEYYVTLTAEKAK